MEVKKNGQTIEQYYDGDGKRIKKIENSVTTIYIYRGLAVLYGKVLGDFTATKCCRTPHILVAHVHT
ncbi:MAG: hypothetical protein ACE5PO_02210 [Candidatus Bathyarchaeia archaeon]